MFNNADIVCKECKRPPDAIREYVDAAEEEGITPEQYVEQEEGTFNPLTGKFYCTECYIKLGMPKGRA